VVFPSLLPSDLNSPSAITTQCLTSTKPSPQPSPPTTNSSPKNSTNGPTPIPEKDFWHNPYLYGNDIGHLVLHLAGNLNYYIGAEIAKTGYIRDRDKEFTDKTPPTKSQALAKFDQAIATVVATIRKQSSDDWSAPYSGEGVDANTRFAILLDRASHADHHIGQILNLARELTR
jgi:Protein of unknown function (DUF1572)